MPARCCTNVIHHAVATDILDEETLARYKLRYEEFCTPKPFHCPVPTCSAFIPPRKLKSTDHHKRLACPTCATRLCTKCRQVAQQGHQCSTAHDAVLAKIRALKYKSCPKCGTGGKHVYSRPVIHTDIVSVLKMYGCDHIRCHCGAHWCWSCERSIDVCFLNPCQAQIDDGIASEPDTDDEEDGYEAEYRATMTAPSFTGTITGPSSGIPSSYPLPSELALASPEEQGGQAFVLPPPRATTPAPEAFAQLLTSNPSAPPIADAYLSETRAGDGSVNLVADSTPDADLPSTSNTSNESTAVVEENLDDPDEHDWEYQDMDFGGEPTDETWDVWGCAHKCRRFKQEDIHEKWLKLEDLDCQNCFERVRLDDNGKSQKDTNVVDRLAWLCKKCGVILCEQCRRDIRAKRKS